MQNIEIARSRLTSDTTLVLARGCELVESCERGVRPLLRLVDTGRDVRDFAAADRVVGRGAAFLYILLGVTELYASVMSEAAAELLDEHRIRYTYGSLVPRIVNRTRDGYCPIECAVMNITEPREALAAIRERLASL